MSLDVSDIVLATFMAVVSPLVTERVEPAVKPNPVLASISILAPLLVIDILPMVSNELVPREFDKNSEADICK